MFFVISGDHVVVWRKGHEVLSAGPMLVSRDPRFKLHKNDFRLELQSIKTTDAGDFTCQISVLGETIEVAHTVEVLGKQESTIYNINLFSNLCVAYY